MVVQKDADEKEIVSLYDWLDAVRYAINSMMGVSISKDFSRDLKVPADPYYFIPIVIKIDDVKTSDCEHHFENYIGFRESYKFCKKCDEKRVIL